MSLTGRESKIAVKYIHTNGALVQSCAITANVCRPHSSVNLRFLHNSPRAFVSLSDGTRVTACTLRNRCGVEVEILNDGVTIRLASCPMPCGDTFDVVIGKDRIRGYEQYRAGIGAVAGRIKGALLDLDGDTRQLPVNQLPDHLHGGPDSLSRNFFHLEPSAMIFLSWRIYAAISP